MSKKSAIILILTIFVLIMAGLLWFYFYSGSVPITPITSPTNTNQNPFGDNSTDKNPSGNQGNNQNNTGTNQGTTPLATLRQIYKAPTSGSVFFTKNSEEKIRFVDRATGNIYETKPDSEEIIRITNTTVPKIQETIWSNSGESLILRYLREDGQIDSFSAKIKIASSTSNEFTGEITGNFLSPNSDSVIINPSGNKAFSLIKKTTNSGSYGVSSSLDGSNKNQIFDSVISEWLVSWPKDSTIAFTTKPSYKNAGFLYFLNTQSGTFEKILGDIYGMTTLINKDSSALIYSEGFRGSARLGFYDIQKREKRNLQISTISDKCVWSNKDKNIVYCAVPKSIPNGSYPDTWYQGTVSFQDNIWKIDTGKGTTSMVYEIESPTSLDAINLRVGNDDSYIIFTDKTDLSLWILSTK